MAQKNVASHVVIVGPLDRFVHPAIFAECPMSHVPVPRIMGLAGSGLSFHTDGESFARGQNRGTELSTVR